MYGFEWLATIATSGISLLHPKVILINAGVLLVITAFSDPIVSQIRASRVTNHLMALKNNL